ncbi:MAG: hypothetical protein A2148_08500 [Chloroflexi bacterium RBG_16_68_14]|nr:MAG: hypothetical protein A2148_08500 [Chloroflexi bacterium RBG_16_68_14]
MTTKTKKTKRQMTPVLPTPPLIGRTGELALALAEYISGLDNHDRRKLEREGELICEHVWADHVFHDLFGERAGKEYIHPDWTLFVKLILDYLRACDRRRMPPTATRL